MSNAAWSALANRFTALAVEQEFDLWLYPASEHDYPPGAAGQIMRFRSRVPLIQTRTGFTGLALMGSSTLTGDEFRRLNRFRWLTWTAGRLLHPAASRPELEWLLAVHQGNRSPHKAQDSAGCVRQIVAASAATARRFADGDCPGIAPADNPPDCILPDSWQSPLSTLRDAFWEHAKTPFEFHLELHGYTNPGLYGQGNHLRKLQEQFLASGRVVNTHSSQEMIYWASSDFEQVYKPLAEHAGRELPEQFISSIRLLPAGVNPIRADQRPNPLLVWAEFLWIANLQNYQVCGDSADLGARKAVWRGGNPFMASVLAIDKFVKSYGPHTLAQLNRQMLELCAWFDQEDRPAALAAIEAAFRGPPVTPTRLPTTSVAHLPTQADAPMLTELPSPFTVPEPNWTLGEDNIPPLENLPPVWTLGAFLQQLRTFAGRYGNPHEFITPPSSGVVMVGTLARSAIVLAYRRTLSSVPAFDELQTQILLRYESAITVSSVNRLIRDVILASGGSMTISQAEQLEIRDAIRRLNSPQVKGSQNASLDQPVTSDNLDRKEGGRPKLGEGPNATPQDKALRNVYELVRSAAQPGLGPKRLVGHFRANRDFRQRVKDAGKDFDEGLFKNALAWLKENPDQETESENIS